jgi:hypothetical protein
MEGKDPDAEVLKYHNQNSSEEAGPDAPNILSDDTDKSGESGENAEDNDFTPNESSMKSNCWKPIIDALLWAPPWCRWHKESPPKFGMPLNILFAFAGTFTVCSGPKPIPTYPIAWWDITDMFFRLPIFTMHNLFWIHLLAFLMCLMSEHP